MNRRKLKQILQREYGKAPDVEYYPGDMDHISRYYETKKEDAEDDFYIDDITWSDLSMDKIFKRINCALSTPGEQYLYYMLRRPIMNEADFKSQNDLISFMDNDPETRLKLQKILYSLGCRRKMNITHSFYSSKTYSGWFWLYLVLGLLFILSLFLIKFFGQIGAYSLLIMATLNGLLHEYRRNKCSYDYNRVNYALSLAYALKNIKKIQHPKLDHHLSSVYPLLDEMRSITQTGYVPSPYEGNILSMLLLVDLIAYEFLKGKFKKHHTALLAIHDALGKIDASISIASYRKNLKEYALPQIDFAAEKPYMEVKKMFHPLITNPVCNDISLQKPLLITGANASGKSTYLKAAGLCALLAQTICTVPCASYQASAFAVFSSMTIADNVLSGDSYYIAEIRSLKRILKSSSRYYFHIFCVIDEVLRGTNTVERIAASSEILRFLAESGTLCIAATHDIELCSLLEHSYTQKHFEEKIDEDSIHFDYKLKEGKATSRNAIRLLKLMGYDENIVNAANKRASIYAETGKWI